MAHSLLVSDGLWAVLEPLLPERPARRVGRPRVDDRVAFTAILFVLLTGLPWRLVPDEIGCSGVTAWRRLRDWQAAGVWAQLHRELLRRLNANRQLDWSDGVVDASHIRALRGGSLTGPSPVDRARTGSKHHLIVDLHGVPLGVELTGGNRNDVTQLLPLVDGIGAIAGKHGRPRQRPDQVIADRGYDPRQVPPRTVAPRRQAGDRAARHRARFGTRTRAVGCGAYVCLVAQLPPTPHPLGTRRQYAPRATEPRMRTHLLATPPAGNAAHPRCSSSTMQERRRSRSHACGRLQSCRSCRAPRGNGKLRAVAGSHRGGTASHARSVVQGW
jgi:transposase